MEFKVPTAIIENFVFSNFKEAKYTGSGEIHFNSPFVNDGKKRLYINPEKKRYYDQKQQKGGSFIDFVAEYLETSTREASIILIREYSNKAGIETDDISYSDVIQTSKELELPNGIKWFFEETKGRTYKLAKNYLTKRGIPTGDLGFVYDPNGDFKKTYHNRIIIPFYEQGRLVYFIGRTFDDSPLRYKNPTGVDTGNFVFQYDKLTDATDIFIFEGVFDALSLAEPQIGTAMLSNKLKAGQITKILDLAPERVVFVTENDKNQIAIDAGKRNLDWNLRTMMKYKPPSLKTKFYVFNPPPPYKDFNEYAVATGKNYIDIDRECKLWEPNKFDVKELQWGRRSSFL